MFNWSVDEKRFKKENPEEYKLWRLTQLINYGLDGERLDKKEVKRAWHKIKDKLDPYKKRALEYLGFHPFIRPGNVELGRMFEIKGFVMTSPCDNNFKEVSHDDQILPKVPFTVISL